MSIAAWSNEDEALAANLDHDEPLAADVNSAAETQKARADAAEFVPGEILVGFEGEVAATYRARGAARALEAAGKVVGADGLHGPRVLMDVPATANRAARLATHWQLPPGADVLQTVAQLTGRPGIAYAEPNYVYSIDATPNDPRFDELWGLDNTGQTGGTAEADIDAPEAWDIATDSLDVVVGMIDTGIDYTHEDLYLNVWINQGEIPVSVTDTDLDGLITFYDLNDPGNAGVVPDSNGNTYIDGGDVLAAWSDSSDNDTNLYIDDIVGWDFAAGDNDPFDGGSHGTHTSGTVGAMGDNATGVVGVNWAVQIMPLKFFYGPASGTTSAAIEAINYAIDEGAQLTSNSWGGGGFSQGLKDAIADSGAANMLFVASAGNGNTDTDANPHYPSSYDLENIISVAATEHNDARASFSNWGAISVDLGAPGVNTLSTTPGDTYSFFNGTSMSAPHVAGTAALAWSIAGAVDYTIIRDAIFAGVDPVGSMSGITATGGRLNAFNTLQEVGMVGIAVSPAAGEVVFTQPTDFVVDFSHPYNTDLAGEVVDASDLTVNGIAATSHTLTDADTVTFHFGAPPAPASPPIEGIWTMYMAAGAVDAAASAGLVDPALKEFNAEFRYDLLEMAVTFTDPVDGSVLTMPFTSLPSASTAIVSQAGMDGGNGGWAVLYDEPTPDSLKLAIDEDQLGDTERSHTTEQAAFVVFENSGLLPSFLETDVAFGVSNDDAVWTTVPLFNSYTSPVVIATPQYDATSPPLVTRIRNVLSSSFEVKVQRTDGLTGTVSADVHYIVAEEGTYTEAVDGVTMEAVKYTSTTTDRSGDGNIHWVGETRSYSNSYVSPAVLGQVMSDNDPDFSVFWSRGSERTEPASSTDFFTGKHIGEDPDLGSDPTDPTTWRADETIGYIVIESGQGTIGSKGYVAGLGPDTLQGMDDSPPFTYSLSFMNLLVNFNEAYDPATLGTDDLAINQGSVIAANVVDADKVAYTLTGIDSEGTLTVNMAGGALTDVFGNPMKAYSGSFDLDWDTFPYPGAPLEPESPLGSLIYDPTVSGFISYAVDTDSFTIDVDPGQTITVVVDPDSNLKPTVELFNPSSGSVGSASATTPGEDAVIQTVGPTNAGTYTVTVGSVDGASTGAYTLQFILNAAAEDQSHGGLSNDDIASAQDIDGSFISLSAIGGERGAVRGAMTSEFVPDRLLDGFEDGNLDEYRQKGTSNTSVTEAAAHDGTYGLQDETNSGLKGWIIRNDTQAQVARGDVISVWIRSDGTPTGRGYFGFGARGNATLAMVAAPNTGSLLIQRVGRYDQYEDLGSAAQTWLPDHWYRMEVIWQTSGAIIGRLYDSDGTTLLNTVTANDTTISSGGIAFRSFDSTKHFDTVEVAPILPDPDVYAFSLDAGQTATVALKAFGGNADLELWDGTTWVPGSTSASNVDEVIDNFVAPHATGTATYYARITGDTQVKYNLVVTRDAVLDLENNSGEPWSGGPAQYVDVGGGSATVLGHVRGGGGGALASASVLYYVDLAHGQDPFLAAMDNLSITPTIASNYGDFATQLQAGGWDLAILLDQNYNNTEWVAPMVDWVSGGGRAIVADWTRNGTAAEAFGATYTGGNNGDPITQVAHPIWDGIADPFDLTNPGWGTFSMGMTATTGTSIGTFPNGNDALIVGNDGRTVLNAFLSDTAQNAAEGVKIAENELIFLGAAEVDFYEVSVPVSAEGGQLVLGTLTPAGGPGEFLNELDPKVRIFDSTGSQLAADDDSADGRNALLSYPLPTTMPAEGLTYYIEVLASDDPLVDPTAGEYVLTIETTSVGPDPGITINKASLLTEEAGLADTLSVRLNTQPSELVTVSVLLDPSDEAVVDQTSFDFTTSNWYQPQTVTVTGADDFVDDDDVAYSVELSASSGDANYNGQSASISAVNLDDDTVGITVSKASVVTRESSDTPVEDTFTVVLDTQPSDSVSINISTSDETEGQLSSVGSGDPATSIMLTFTSGNWGSAQTVTVTGVDDDEPDGDIEYTITVTPTGAEEYAALAPITIAATNFDDEMIPLSWWTADATLRDVTGPNNGTLTGGATFGADREGQADSAFSFDGVDDFVQAPTANLPTGNSNRTLELWVYANSFPASGEAYFAGYGAFGSYNQTYHLGTTGNELFFSQWGTGIGGPALTPDQWYHVAVTNVGDLATLYLDGTMESSGSVPINTPADTNFFIGRIEGSHGDSRKLDGLVDEVTVYNRALSADEILSIYDGTSLKEKPSAGITITPLTALTTGLVTTETGEIDTFTVSLTEAPASSVTVSIDVRTGDNTEGMISSTSETGPWSDSLTLALTQSNLSQTVWVQGQDDTESDLNVAYTIITAPAVVPSDTSSPYHGMDADDVFVINIDDDTAPEPTKYDSTDVPKNIVDLGTITSELIIGADYPIVDLNVQLNIAHRYDADLDVYLIAPDNTRVELFTDVGGSYNNFTDTILDDEAATPITSGSAPFTGSFRPEGNLSAFDGISVYGVWTLEVTDDYKKDKGNLNSWQIMVTHASSTGGTTTSTFASQSTSGMDTDRLLLLAAALLDQSPSGDAVGSDGRLGVNLLTLPQYDGDASLGEPTLTAPPRTQAVDHIMAGLERGSGGQKNAEKSDLDLVLDDLSDALFGELLGAN